MFSKDLTETPVRPAHHVILYLLRECALDLIKGYIPPVNGDAPEAICSHARG